MIQDMPTTIKPKKRKLDDPTQIGEWLTIKILTKLQNLIVIVFPRKIAKSFKYKEGFDVSENIETSLYLKHFAMFDKNIVHYIFEKHFAMFQINRNRNVS